MGNQYTSALGMKELRTERHNNKLCIYCGEENNRYPLKSCSDCTTKNTIYKEDYRKDTINLGLCPKCRKKNDTNNYLCTKCAVKNIENKDNYLVRARGYHRYRVWLSALDKKTTPADQWKIKTIVAARNSKKAKTIAQNRTQGYKALQAWREDI